MKSKNFFLTSLVLAVFGICPASAQESSYELRASEFGIYQCFYVTDRAQQVFAPVDLSKCSDQLSARYQSDGKYCYQLDRNGHLVGNLVDSSKCLQKGSTTMRRDDWGFPHCWSVNPDGSTVEAPLAACGGKPTGKTKIIQNGCYVLDAAGEPVISDPSAEACLKGASNVTYKLHNFWETWKCSAFIGGELVWSKLLPIEKCGEKIVGRKVINDPHMHREVCRPVNSKGFFLESPSGPNSYDLESCPEFKEYRMTLNENTNSYFCSAFSKDGRMFNAPNDLSKCNEKRTGVFTLLTMPGSGEKGDMACHDTDKLLRPLENPVNGENCKLQVENPLLQHLAMIRSGVIKVKPPVLDESMLVKKRGRYKASGTQVEDGPGKTIVDPAFSDMPSLQDYLSIGVK